MSWPDLLDAAKWHILVIVVLIVLYRPLSKLLTRLIDLQIKRREWDIEMSFRAHADAQPRPQALQELIALIQTTGAKVENLAIECLLQEYVSNQLRWSEKLAIGDFVANSCLHDPKAIILDTGTTVAAVATQIMARPDWPDLVMTNSVTTAAFLSVTKSIHKRSGPTVYTPPGFVHAEYRGSYLLRNDLRTMSECEYEKLINTIHSIPPHLFQEKGAIYGIVAATYFSSSHGPGANSEWNRQWKRDTFKLADHVIIVVDISKVRSCGSGLFSEAEWLHALKTKDIRIVIAGTPSPAARTIANAEIDAIKRLETRLKKTLVYHGQSMAGVWEFVSRDDTTSLGWGIPASAPSKPRTG